jgi:7-carboxy-7-deazaguanine synthase (Cx14CxxC type)
MWKNIWYLCTPKGNWMYAVKEIYYTIQGEGFYTGRPAIFCRFSGCNLWSGREEDRHKAICKFCDTDFWGTDGLNGGKYTAEELRDQINAIYPLKEPPFIVLTGGEPSLQVDEKLVEVFKNAGFEIAIETNGTKPLPDGIDWICLSPKAYTKIVLKKANELKIVYPQEGISPFDFDDLIITHRYIQPMEDEAWEENTLKALNFVKSNPGWKLSVQSHKYLNIP